VTRNGVAEIKYKHFVWMTVGTCCPLVCLFCALWEFYCLNVWMSVIWFGPIFGVQYNSFQLFCMIPSHTLHNRMTSTWQGYLEVQ
jgi:hypothetical protein